MKKLTIASMILLSVTILISCTSNTNSPPEEVEIKHESYTIGDTFKMGNLLITIDKLDGTPKVNNGMMTSSLEGFLHITVENKGETPAHLAGLTISEIYNADGYKVSISGNSGEKTSQELQGSLAADRRAKGQLHFVISDGFSGEGKIETENDNFELVFNPMFSDSGKDRISVIIDMSEYRND